MSIPVKAASDTSRAGAGWLKSYPTPSASSINANATPSRSGIPR